MYARHAKEVSKKNIIINLVLIIVLLVNLAIVQAANTDENIINPSPNQYFELRATQIKDVERSE